MKANKGMMTLHEAIEAKGGKNGRFVVKHLKGAGIEGWNDCTKLNLAEFPDYLTRVGVCQSTACQYVAVLKAVLNRYSETGVIPCTNIKEALKCKNEKAQKVYLNESELERLENVPTKNDRELFVKLCFLISVKTGMRVSDTLRASKSNASNGMFRYVSQKTSIEACVPISDKTIGWIEEVNTLEVVPNPSTYEVIIKRLCERAGIDEPMKLFRAGVERTEPKWKFVTSHTARVTFATSLSQLKIPIQDIATMMGHATPAVTANYIVRTAPKMDERAMAYFR